MPASRPTKPRNPNEKSESRSPEEKDRIWHNTRRPPRHNSATNKKKIFLVNGGEKTLRSGVARANVESTAGGNVGEEVDELMSEGSGDEEENGRVLPDAQNIGDQIHTAEQHETPSPSPAPLEPNQQYEEERRAAAGARGEISGTPESQSDSESEVLFSPTPGATAGRKRASSNPPAGEPAARRDAAGVETNGAKMPEAPGLEAIASLLDDKLRRVATVDDVNQAVRAVAEKVELNSSVIRELAARLTEVERRNNPGTRTPSTAGRKEKEAGDTHSVYLAGARTLAQEDARVTEFEVARRSMRIWPIRGENEDSMREALGEFFRGALMMQRHEVDFLPICDVKRAKATDSAYVHGEVIVTFDCAGDRDEIYRKAAKLAPYRDERNKPTAGFRQEIPQYLMSAHKLLTETGFQLKRQHGPNFRWYVKYDDENYSLYLEVKMPGTFSWQRVSLQMAREMREEAGRSEVMIRRPRPDHNTPQESVNHIPIGSRSDRNNISGADKLAVGGPTREGGRTSGGAAVTDLTTRTTTRDGERQDGNPDQEGSAAHGSGRNGGEDVVTPRRPWKPMPRRV